MKRVIKFWNQYSSDAGKFSDCSTRYEILPILVPDSAGPKELLAIARQLGISTQGRKVLTMPDPTGYRRGETRTTHALKTGEVMTRTRFNDKTETFNWYIGFVTLNEKHGILKPSEKIGKKVTRDQANQIIDGRAYGLSDVGDFSMRASVIDDRIVMEHWGYYHEMNLLGYDRDQFEKMVTRSRKNQDGEREFEDSVFSCSDCGTWDSNDNGYTYNYRITDGEQLGLNCGCYDEHCKENFAKNANNHKKSIEADTANELENDGKIERLETFVGGMTDGRGGYFKGESTRPGTPEGVLAEYREKFPKVNFLFIHEESGQFQSYFTIAKLTDKTKRKAA